MTRVLCRSPPRDQAGATRAARGDGRVPVRVHHPWALRRAAGRRERGQRRDHRAPGAHRGQPRPGGRRPGGPLGHDGRARRRDQGGAGRGGVLGDPDPRLLGQVRLGLLRAVPRRRRLHAGIRRSAGLPDGSRKRARGGARGVARRAGGGRHGHGQAGTRLRRSDLCDQERRRAAARGLQRQRRVRDGQGRRGRRRHRRACGRARDPHVPTSRGRRHDHLLPRKGRGPMADRTELKEHPSKVGLEPVAVPKTRSRKDGAAIPLDDLDRRLLNLMQGSFPIAPRPYRHVSELSGISEAEVMSRVQRLLAKRIIRQVTPIFDTRALGYSSMLVAAKVDPEHPHRAARVINEHPGVSHNYLRNHEFNLWFTIATEPDSELGLEGTLEVLARAAGAESVRQLPTLRLFKIRMDLEMEGDTQALASAAEVKEPIELEPQPYDELDIAVIRALQGDMPVVSEPYAPAAAALGLTQERLLDHLAGMQERGLLRRVAAILYHRRAGFSANGMGVWKVPDEQIFEIGCRMAAVRGVSHCYQRPTYEDWPYSVFTMAHGRSKEECDAVLDAIAEQTGIHERATLYSSTEFKKIRLLYFTEDFKKWESAHAG